MAASMEQIVSKTFTRATLVTDCFHVQKLAFEAVQYPLWQQMRIEYRWEAIEQENQEIELSRQLGRTFIPNRLENGDTPKQLLARSCYLLFKRKDCWTPSQVHRAEILFRLYPRLQCGC